MLAPSRADASTQFLKWLESMDGEGRIFLSAVTVVEIERGIPLLEKKGAVAKALGLRAWLSGLIATYDDKIIGLDTASAKFAGQLGAKAIAAGYNPGMADAIIAGIAKAHDLMVVTCNTKHFLPFGNDVASPEEAVAIGQLK